MGMPPRNNNKINKRIIIKNNFFNIFIYKTALSFSNFFTTSILCKAGFCSSLFKIKVNK